MDTAKSLPDGTRVAQVQLRTSALEKSLALYHGVLGLTVVERADGRASSAEISALLGRGRRGAR